MSTPEERQEAAEYLRENSIGDVVITPYTGHADPIRFPGYKLADLIDPTCVVDSVDSTAGLPAYNLSCGDTVFVHLNEPMPSYCPYCGARIVGDDD